jgi:RIO-like serine/threonine protein kinase
MKIFNDKAKYSNIRKGGNFVEEYFKDIVLNLSPEDLTIISVLNEKEAKAPFKAVRSQLVHQTCGLTESKYRRSISKLISLLLISSKTERKEHSLYITHYGLLAMDTLMKIAEEG